MNEITDALNLKKNSWWYILWPQKSFWQCGLWYFVVKIRILWQNRYFPSINSYLTNRYQRV